ncbi:MAG: bifunctional phosphoribosylaminoimidazolecarboxamide formyltransferase/IMP cyclohydrolase [Pirellulales bacterium]
MTDSPKVKRALVSVSNKLGLTDFARGLVAADVEIYASGGTRRHLQDAGVAVREVAEYTGFPELLEGRLKTLHPKVHGGILCRHDRPDDLAALAEHGIVTFELVVVNLYPFEATVGREGVSFEEAIEQIDIGGPTLVRAAAKNHAFTTVATDTAQYSAILEQIAQSGATTPELRRELALAAFSHTASYDKAIAQYLSREQSEEPMPRTLRLELERKATLRYGENPHQQAALYAPADVRGANLVTAQKLHGKELSYNNLLDLDSALALVRTLPDYAAVVIKHNNPCGAASADSLAAAIERAWAGDPVSAFGSVLGFNQTVDAGAAEFLTGPDRFVEAIIAPDFTPEALEILTTRPKWKANVRLLKAGPLSTGEDAWQLRDIDGGYLLQESDLEADPEGQWNVPTKAQPDDAQWADLRFTWAVCRYVRSNAIVLGKNRALAGVGAGQMSRVDAVEIALRKSDEDATGCVLASDAFFPFRDSIDRAADAGIAAVIQPGGSRNDDQVVTACDEHNIPMIFTGRRHFRH